MDLIRRARAAAARNGWLIRIQADQPRLAQYISMHVADEADEAKRQVRVNCWRNRLPPPYPHFPGDPRKIEEQLGTPAQLTPLGRKVLGLDSWG